MLKLFVFYFFGCSISSDWFELADFEVIIIVEICLLIIPEVTNTFESLLVEFQQGSSRVEQWSSLNETTQKEFITIFGIIPEAPNHTKNIGINVDPISHIEAGVHIFVWLKV